MIYSTFQVPIFSLTLRYLESWWSQTKSFAGALQGWKIIKTGSPIPTATGNFTVLFLFYSLQTLEFMCFRTVDCCAVHGADMVKLVPFPLCVFFFLATVQCGDCGFEFLYERESISSSNLPLTFWYFWHVHCMFQIFLCSVSATL